MKLLVCKLCELNCVLSVGIFLETMKPHFMPGWAKWQGPLPKTKILVPVPAKGMPTQSKDKNRANSEGTLIAKATATDCDTGEAKGADMITHWARARTRAIKFHQPIGANIVQMW